jgi:hypothetical protein
VDGLDFEPDRQLGARVQNLLQRWEESEANWEGDPLFYATTSDGDGQPYLRSQKRRWTGGGLPLHLSDTAGGGGVSLLLQLFYRCFLV